MATSGETSRWLNAEWIIDRDEPARAAMASAATIALAVGDGLRDHREDRGRRAVQHRGAEAAHDPEQQRRLAESRR